jgi:hypothetical protein
MQCRVWAERLRYWVRDHVMAGLLARMAEVSRSAAGLQHSRMFPFVISPLVPDAASGWSALQLPSDEMTQQAASAARQAKVAAQQATATQQPAFGKGYFAVPMSMQQQQQQEEAQRARELRRAAKVWSTITMYV